MLHSIALEELDRQVRKVHRHLTLDRHGAALIQAALALGLWLSAVLLGWPQRLPALAQTALTLAALAGVAALVFHGYRRHPAPTLVQARSELASASALDPGAFEILDDRPTDLSESGLALWRAARAQAVSTALSVTPKPRFNALNAADPWRLRFGLIPLLAVALFFAGPARMERLGEGLWPNPGPLLGDSRLAIEAWATPADYVNAPPITLTDQTGLVVTPPSVTVTVRVQGAVGAPVLVFDPRAGPTIRQDMRKAADGAFETTLALPGPGVLRVVRFHTVARWRIAPQPDAPPTANFAARPETGDGEDVVLSWAAADDYGVRVIALSVRPIDPPEGLREAPAHVTVIEGPAGDPLTAAGETEIDLAEHPYAGMQVEMRILARDALGQEGVSAPARITMPEKVFLQPLALAALEIRRTILWERRPYAPMRPAPGGPVTFPPSHDGLLGIEPLVFESDDQFPTLERSPEAIRRAAHLLDALTMAPQDGYFSDLGVYANLRYARSVLANATAIKETDAAAAILWRVALRAEYGSPGNAAEALARAQQALADALARGAAPDRIRRLMEALEKATQNYLDSLVAEALQRTPPEQSDALEDAEEMAELSERDIEDVLEEVERLAQEGRTEEAQALLQAFSDLLENLEVRLADGPGANPNGEGTEGGEGQAARGFNETMREQRALRDETQSQGESASPNGEDPNGEGQEGEDGEALAQRQEALREDLSRARRQAGEAGATDNSSLQSADEAMGRAAEALQRGDYEEAAAAQDEALDNLMDGAEQANREMRAQRNARGGAEGQSAETDPLGRDAPNGQGRPDADDGEALPAEAERARARDILDELRRRSQDQTRPQEERDYLLRLLDRFEGS
jgi:hypothetical protein